MLLNQDRSSRPVDNHQFITRIMHQINSLKLEVKIEDKLKVKLTSYLINELDSEAKIKQLSAVAPEIAEKRVKLKKTLGLLDDSMQILQDLSHTSF